jgi:hypothetical protein
LGGNPSALKQALDSWVQRPIVYKKLVFGLLLEKLRDSVGVIRLEFEAAKDQDLKSPLKESEPFVVG